MRRAGRRKGFANRSVRRVLFVRRAFDAVAVAVRDVAKIEVVFGEGDLRPGCTADENHRVGDAASRFEVADEAVIRAGKGSTWRGSFIWGRRRRRANSTGRRVGPRVRRPRPGPVLAVDRLEFGSLNPVVGRRPATVDAGLRRHGDSIRERFGSGGGVGCRGHRPGHRFIHAGDILG